MTFIRAIELEMEQLLADLEREFKRQQRKLNLMRIADGRRPIKWEEEKE